MHSYIYIYIYIYVTVASYILIASYLSFANALMAYIMHIAIVIPSTQLAIWLYLLEEVFVAPFKPSCLQIVFATSSLVYGSQHMGTIKLLIYTWTKLVSMISPFVLIPLTRKYPMKNMVISYIHANR